MFNETYIYIYLPTSLCHPVYQCVLLQLNKSYGCDVDIPSPQKSIENTRNLKSFYFL